jgi:lysophospholipase L1-like esterase
MKLRVLIAVVALVVAPAALAEPGKTGYPNAMASTGDSITRAFNTGWLPFADWPPNSWSTGTSATVNSHYRRILAANPSILGRNRNDAVTGADMADLDGQVQAAVAQRVEYVTILMGANDVCASSEAAMTPVGTFRAQFEQAMATVSAGLPNARVYVVSIPDVYQLWAIYKDSFSARTVWALGGICQSMLARPTSTQQADVARRNRVRQRNIDYNAQLAQVCDAYVHCRFDANAIFNTAFARSDVSTRDYFHPSVAGQTKLASVSWTAGFGFGDAVAPSSTSTATPADGATSVSITATDNVAVKGVEYKLGGSGWTRYAGPVTVPTGIALEWRAVDVNGNYEASKQVVG